MFDTLILRYDVNVQILSPRKAVMKHTIRRFYTDEEAVAFARSEAKQGKKVWLEQIRAVVGW